MEWVLLVWLLNDQIRSEPVVPLAQVQVETEQGCRDAASTILDDFLSTGDFAEDDFVFSCVRGH